jgi:hypothetical protein
MFWWLVVLPSLARASPSFRGSLEIASSPWLAHCLASRSYLVALGACCQGWLRALSIGPRVHMIFPSLIPSSRSVNCWVRSKRTETWRQSIWVPQFSTAGAELSVLFVPIISRHIWGNIPWVATCIASGCANREDLCNKWELTWPIS